MKRLLLRFRSFCVSSFPLVAFALTVCNFVVSCSVSRAAKPEYRYRLYVVTNVVHEVVSSVVTSVVPSSASSPVRSSQDLRSLPGSSAFSDPGPPVYRMPYRYFVFNGRPSAMLNGVPHTVGSYTSRGLIVSVYPDRIIFLDGASIENTLAVPDSLSQKSKGVKKND